MSEDQSQALTAITSSLNGLPEPVKTSLLAALSRTLGGLASFPAAWFRRPVQSYEDTTDARSLVAKGLAQAVLENARNDPVIVQAASEVFMPDALRKLANRGAVATVAVEEVSRSKMDGVNAAPPDEDWMNTFLRYSEGASSERLQLLFGKILAGEVIHPGAYSPTMLRLVSELTKPIAEDFQWLWSKNIGAWVHNSEELRLGEGWTRVNGLRDAGLVSSLAAAFHAPSWGELKQGTVAWTLGEPPIFLNLKLKASNVRPQILHIDFTRAGRELGSLLPPADRAQNLFNLAKTLSRTHFSEAYLIVSSEQPLPIFRADV